MERDAPTPAEAARTFAARDRAAREARERRETETRARVVAAVQAQLRRGTRAWLIGSLAWGGFGEHSDVDLVVRGVDPRVALELERAVARLAGVPVELLDWDELPEPFRRRIEAEGIAIDGA
jgi:predicted nucleotidyltransferase